jgi:transmembrane sensor
MKTETDDLAPTPLELEAYGFVVRFVAGDAGPDDLQALKAWVGLSPEHRAAFDDASRVWARVDPTRSFRPAARKPASFHRPGSGHTLARRAFLGGALAASAAGTAGLLNPPLGLWPSWSELASDYRTQPGERRSVALADSGSVELNTRTSIALRSSGHGAQRLELIQGEALVSTSAKDGAAVTVLASGGKVVASDARFNIRQGDASVSVTCLAGKVQVECGGASLSLPALHQVAYSDDGIGLPIAVDTETVTAWKDGFIVFDAMPVSEVVTEINRYRRGTVILTNNALGRKRFNARFRVEHVDGVIGQIEQVFGARATALPGGIILLG